MDNSWLPPGPTVRM
jgi:hypothetical protein